ncbi:hypothetical protein N7468_009171 [Penicillium chermesinum]|uniref:Uncharacterized protein n=1 Tax=Penicillium chermesinum TaxID=63820 RepID=A0A9W9NHI0_9EURO|nr:uncharacterized protein N7468_009171 [Penicillium chermesinum]KAJ5219967.1 hypothetical protein N7468_009171 [Penicillium chermesinum]
MVYTDSAASWRCYDMDPNAEDTSSIKVDIGKADERAARWWAAILAPSKGWKATVTQRNGTSYISPWSLCLENEPGFGIIWQDNGTGKEGTAPLCPLSSQSALELLAEFCSLHDLGGQCWAAFATALTFPTHKQYEITIQLPRPTTAQGQAKHSSNIHLISEYLSAGRDLAYYISLSCNYSVLISSLCGSFWEPSIACNLVSPWLHPILEKVPRATGIAENAGRYHEIIALLCGMRRPRLKGLWEGAALSGLVPKVIDLVKSGTPPLDPNGFPWTASPQTFMDSCGAGPYFYRRASGDNAIRRSDAWRLLYLPTSADDGLYYNSLPFSPWYPTGETVEKNCAFRVRVHKSCSRHRLAQTSWSWQLQDGSSLNGRIFRAEEPVYLQPSKVARSRKTHRFVCPPVALSPSQDASHAAFFEAFRWVLANHEGRPNSEPVYDDDWIAGCDDSDECYSETEEISHSNVPTNNNEEIFAQELKGCVDRALSSQGDSIK